MPPTGRLSLARDVRTALLPRRYYDEWFRIGFSKILMRANSGLALVPLLSLLLLPGFGACANRGMKPPSRDGGTRWSRRWWWAGCSGGSGGRGGVTGVAGAGGMDAGCLPHQQPTAARCRRLHRPVKLRDQRSGPVVAATGQAAFNAVATSPAHTYLGGARWRSRRRSRARAQHTKGVAKSRSPPPTELHRQDGTVNFMAVPDAARSRNRDRAADRQRGQDHLADVPSRDATWKRKTARGS